ncbi:uncharacterized protein LOC129809186 [Phlebotomus papatasi]|uniref:uncharacterized protein LOC129809186 n=1 Tax=Phlebotomus papatasi TaxID=29031 RepID=UPI0024846D59|nr:uncharacterized protein LOC129809186 [Phlebotomus papatasi]
MWNSIGGFAALRSKRVQWRFVSWVLLTFLLLYNSGKSVVNPGYNWRMLDERVRVVFCDTLSLLECPKGSKEVSSDQCEFACDTVSKSSASRLEELVVKSPTSERVCLIQDFAQSESACAKSPKGPGRRSTEFCMRHLSRREKRAIRLDNHLRRRSEERRERLRRRERGDRSPSPFQRPRTSFAEPRRRTSPSRYSSRRPGASHSARQRELSRREPSIPHVVIRPSREKERERACEERRKLIRTSPVVTASFAPQ